MKISSLLESIGRIAYGALSTLTIAAVVRAQPSMPRRDGSGEVTAPSSTDASDSPRSVAPGSSALAKPPTPSVTLPKAVTTPVDYPSSASGRAEVLLEITVDAEGRVHSPKLLSGEAIFADAALAAVSRWRFLPARRGDTEVAAKIRFLVKFTPPIDVAPAPTTAQTQATVRGPTVSAKPSRNPTRSSNPSGQLEVTITGERPEAAVVSMGRADVEQMPGAFGDPFRAIDSLPGVTPIVSGLPFFFIRGAPPGNQGYFLDGIRVPLLYHLAAGPGVIHPALVDRVDLYAGGYPARYGRFAGAIVTGESKDPVPEYHAQGTVRLVDSGAFVTAPLGRGAIALGGRYSYTAAVVSLIVPQIKIDYWDYQVKAVQYLSDRDTVGVFAFGSLDLVQDKTSNRAESLVGTEFHRVDLRYERRVSNSTRWRSAVTVGLDKTLAGKVMTVRDRMLALRSDLEYRFLASATLRVGVNGTLDAYDVILPVPDASSARLRRAIPERKDMVAGVWADLPFEASRNITVVPGIRLDHYWSGNATALAVEPRLSAVFALRKTVRLTHAFGVAQQPPSFIVPIPGFQISGLNEGLQRSLQSSAGVEWDLPSEVTASGTLFQNSYFNLTDQLSNVNQPASGDKIIPNQRSRGHTFGAELLIRRSFSQRVGGLLAYTLSKSWRTINGERHAAAFDRRHVLQAALAFNLGRHWRSSIRAVVYSGVPSQYERDGYFGGTDLPPTAAPVGSQSALDAAAATTRRDSDRLPRTPAFYRLDLRLQKRWLVGNNGAYWAMTFEMLNATLNREVVSQSCSVSSCRAERFGPVTVPSIGVEAAY